MHLTIGIEYPGRPQSTATIPVESWLECPRPGQPVFVRLRNRLDSVFVCSTATDLPP